MYYCLNKDELGNLIQYKANDAEIENESLRSRIDDSECWRGRLGSLTYLFSQILERPSKEGEDCLRLITILYGLPDSMEFALHECGSGFVDFMLSNIRNRELSLEEDLVEVQTHRGRYEYGTTIRSGH
jgi:hypothetical protein